jgi:hypothetical protein
MTKILWLHAGSTLYLLYITPFSMKSKLILLLATSILQIAAIHAQPPLQWDELGPKSLGGRTRSILIDRRDSTRSTVYAGAASGGLWKSTDHGANWQPILPVYTCAAVSCIAQDMNGRIYFGTGEGFAQPHGSSKSIGSLGNGLHFLYDNDRDSILPSTASTSFASNVDWLLINRIAINPTNPNDIYAATSGSGNNIGLQHSVDGGQTWVLVGSAAAPISGLASGYNGAADVKFNNNGTNIYASVGTYQSVSIGTYLIVSNDGGNTFTYITNPSFPINGGRIEIGAAPSSHDTVYISVCTGYGSLAGIFVSGDQGNTWTEIGTNAGVLNNAFGTDGQGWFDNVIAVDPHNADLVYFGGVQLYSYSSLIGWTLASIYFGNQSDPQWIAPDFNVIVFNDLSPNEMYTGSGGGIFRSTNAISSFPNPTYSISNNGYSVTQMYSVSADLYSDVLGGTEEQGTEYVPIGGNTNPSFGTNGSYAEISHFDSTIFIGGSGNGYMRRSNNLGYAWLNMYDTVIDPLNQDAPSVCGMIGGNAPFITDLWLVETKTATNSVSKVKFADNVPHNAGDVVTVTSHIGYTFQDTLTVALPAGDTVSITDRLQSRLYLATSCGLWMTPDILDFTKTPRWFRITNDYNDVLALAASPTGDTIFFSTGYKVNRISGLNSVYFDTFSVGQDSIIITSAPLYQQAQTTVTASGRRIEGIDADLNNPNHVLCTVAGFSAPGTPHVYVSSDAGTTWATLQSNLPNMPVYQCVIDAYNPSHYILGTELGFWDSQNGGGTWTEQNGGIVVREPIYRLRQQTYLGDHCYALYAGTHGRGMWRCTSITEAQAECPVIPLGITNNIDKPNSGNMTLYPNPMDGAGHVMLELIQPSDVTLLVMDMMGRVLRQDIYKYLNDGKNIFNLNTSTLENGSYLVVARLTSGQTYTRTMVVAR